MSQAFYFDTSALIKRYIPEAGSNWVRRIMRTAANNQIVISNISLVECVSAFSRLMREGHISVGKQDRLHRLLLWDAQEQYIVVPVDKSLLTSARHLVTRYPLRTLDAVHLASTMRITSELTSPLTFVCSDKKLLAAAQGEGFVVDDPNAHPD